MKLTASTGRLSLAVVGLLLLVPANAEAHYRHRHRHYGASAFVHFSHGYHCPLGQYWRPSLGVCQGRPYGVAMDQPTGSVEDFSGPPEGLRADRPSVTTDTRVVSRSRVVSGSSVVVKYVVRTRVVENYRIRPRGWSPQLTKVSSEAPN